MTDDRKADAGGIISAIILGAVLVYTSLGASGCAGSPVGHIAIGSETMEAYYDGEVALLKEQQRLEQRRGRR